MKCSKPTCTHKAQQQRKKCFQCLASDANCRERALKTKGMAHLGMTISLVYSVAMTHLCLQIRGNKDVIKVKAHAVREDDANGFILAMDAQGNVIGKFNRGEVQGWWTEDLRV